jgi:hypothetical protein
MLAFIKAGRRIAYSRLDAGFLAEHENDDQEGARGGGVASRP